MAIHARRAAGCYLRNPVYRGQIDKKLRGRRSAIDPFGFPAIRNRPGQGGRDASRTHAVFRASAIISGRGLEIHGPAREEPGRCGVAQCLALVYKRC